MKQSKGRKGQKAVPVSLLVATLTWFNTTWITVYGCGCYIELFILSLD